MKVTLDNIRLPEKGKTQAFNGKSHFRKLFKENLDFHSVILNKILDLQVGEVTRFLSENPAGFSIQESYLWKLKFPGREWFLYYQP